MSSQKMADATGGIMKVFTMIPNMLKNAFGPLFNLLSSFSVFEPVMELMSAIVDIFGIAFIPVVQMIVQLVTPFIPILVEIATLLQPLFTLLFQLLTPFGLLANVIFPVLVPLLEGLSIILTALNPLFTMLSDALKSLTLENIIDWFTDLGDFCLDAIVKGFWVVIDWFAKLPGVIWDAIKKAGEDLADWITFWD